MYRLNFNCISDEKAAFQALMDVAAALYSANNSRGISDEQRSNVFNLCEGLWDISDIIAKHMQGGAVA